MRLNNKTSFLRAILGVLAIVFFYSNSALQHRLTPPLRYVLLTGATLAVLWCLIDAFRAKPAAPHQQ
jgi:hypothetical protein